jgi:hypothetical protein
MAHATHAVHAMEAGIGGSETGGMTGFSCRGRSATVAAARVRSSSAFTVNAPAFAVDCLCVLRMRRCLA